MFSPGVASSSAIGGNGQDLGRCVTHKNLSSVIHAKAGIQIPGAARAQWIPAFAGMTIGADPPQFPK